VTVAAQAMLVGTGFPNSVKPVEVDVTVAAYLRTVRYVRFEVMVVVGWMTVTMGVVLDG
jgi:hypothetical protein